ncbi:zinc-binding alcohol dehydrogenase family protein [Paenibacillus thalictri]|uniref:Zinc-binding alcohol dehydrogenase family protein n=1 Tax=Paenibacillus thalictri TaxID=2527873 RepID=A0A4Q9DEV7_9BACL|nr:zinc-binding alcohol dehydrogenase family protein [Paenibacillus thalictri]TBL70302.1 zinc-binding alcohol dehydrogenase family protein [Paenibacillus thalictri]
MKAAVMTAPYKIGIQEVEKPVPKGNEVLVRMKAAGICGGDIHFYDGSHPYAQYPQIFGHELCGIIEAVGAEVTRWAVGDRVVIEPAIPCGTCYSCRIGKYNCCPRIDMIGGWRPGGFAEYVTAPEAYVHGIPNDMPFEIGALCEPFSIGAQVVSRAEVQDGATVAILGMGPIGLTILLLLKKMYNVKVFVVDVIADRLEQARLFGADVLINPKETDTIKSIEELTDGEGANIVIESAGLRLTMEQTIELVSPGGRIVIVGLTGDQVTFPGVLFTKKEVEIYGSRNNVNKFPDVIRFLHEHQDIARQYITRTMPFSDIAEALHLAKSNPHEINKIVLNYDEEKR